MRADAGTREASSGGLLDGIRAAQRRGCPTQAANARRSRRSKPVGALALGLVIAAGCGSRERDHGELAGRELARGITTAITAAHKLTEPYRCAALSGPPPTAAQTFEARGVRVEVRGREATLHLAAGAPLRTAFVGDARGARVATTVRLRELGKRFAADGVQLIVSLGGMATERDELREVLGALAESGIVVVAISGDRESLPAHRAAIAELAVQGTPIVDGSTVRAVTAGELVIATFPGVEHTRQLVSGADGCRHTAEDAAAVSRDLAERKASVKVWAGYAPPRQEGPSGSDIGRSGVHVGALSLTRPVAESGAQLVVHAMVDEAVFGPATGDMRIGSSNRTMVGVGPVDALPVQVPGRPVAGGSAVVASLSATRVRWQRIMFEAPQVTISPQPGH